MEAAPSPVSFPSLSQCRASADLHDLQMSIAWDSLTQYLHVLLPARCAALPCNGPQLLCTDPEEIIFWRFCLNDALLLLNHSFFCSHRWVVPTIPINHKFHFQRFLIQMSQEWPGWSLCFPLKIHKRPHCLHFSRYSYLLSSHNKSSFNSEHFQPKVPNASKILQNKCGQVYHRNGTCSGYQFLSSFPLGCCDKTLIKSSLERKALFKNRVQSITVHHEGTSRQERKAGAEAGVMEERRSWLAPSAYSFITSIIKCPRVAPPTAG